MADKQYYISKRLFSIALLIFTVLISGLFTTSVLAIAQAYESTPDSQQLDPANAGQSEQVGGITDAREFEAFLDQFFAEKMHEYHIPGAVFVAVKDGQTLLAKGYGLANIAGQIPADPAKSLFRVASVSKIFAAIAVMQMAEQGQISLTDDVNKYLTDFKVINPFDRALTIRDLLTHTDGFEERNTNVFALHAESMPPLGELLAANLPPLVLPPGEMITYGSFASAVASYIVEIVSGMPFEQYVEEKILKPLGMEHTTLKQSFTPEEMKKLAVVYQYQDGQYIPSPFLYLTTPATGGASAVGTEMGRLLTMFLQQGQLNDTRILQPQTVEAMLSRQFSPHPELPGVTYGFFEHYENCLRGLIREGSGVGVNSRIFLLPEQNLGFYIAYNTRGGEMSTELTSMILDRYYPTRMSTTQYQNLQSLVAFARTPQVPSSQSHISNAQTQHTPLLQPAGNEPQTQHTPSSHPAGNEPQTQHTPSSHPAGNEPQTQHAPLSQPAGNEPQTLHTPSSHSQQSQSTTATENGSVGEIAGLYRYVHYSRHTITKISALLASLVKVETDSAGMLTITPLAMGDPYGGFEGKTRWQEVQTLVYQREDGKGLIAFSADTSGRVTKLYSGMGYHGTFERLAWYQTPTFNLILVGVLLLILLSAQVGWLIGWRKLALPGKIVKWAWVLVGVVNLINLLYLVVGIPTIFFAGMTAGFPSISFIDNLHPAVVVFSLLPVISVVLTLGLAAFALVIWKRSYWTIGWNLYYTLVTVSSLLTISFLDYWNLTGF